ncbi:MAG: DUF411 domain-containing protein [Rhodospirillales bacterium]|nr:DUF411 domain-containing protein [Rhodospirillales bacterium]MSP79826.1 DUF411 domain-containing protein [Rhodospirillales bacterium]
MRLPIRAALFALAFVFAPGAATADDAVLYKNPDCGCCGDYAKYLEGEGFRVRVKETTALDALRRMSGVPDKLASCHTMTIVNYVVEGHVPVAAVRKLLAEKPDIRGIALPGMPQGSPGMIGQKEGPFVVYKIGRRAASGQAKVFATE